MSSQIHQQHRAQGSPAAASPATSVIEAGVSNLSIEAAAAAARQNKDGNVSRQQQLGEQKTTQRDSPTEHVAKMENRAGQSSSPYVQSHASSPVKWQLLDSEAVDRARRENKVIFLSIGFKACHYCRLMSEESFSHPSVSHMLNTSFVPIIVDREERPDIDAIYMNYFQLVESVGGWPLNVFLTPDLAPIYGGTYWPASSAQDDRDDEELPVLDFTTVLERIERTWREDEERCRQDASEVMVKLREYAAEGTLGTKTMPQPVSGIGGSDGSAWGRSAAALGTSVGTYTDASSGPGPAVGTQGDETELDLDQLDEAQAHIAKTFDAVNGGFGRLPGNKFPVPPKLSFLLRLSSFGSETRDVIGDEDIKLASDMVLFTLRRLRDGGLIDQIGAGFYRYSATQDWAAPHYEKMVADNALLLGVYLDAWLLQSQTQGKPLKKEDEFADVVLSLADYLTSPPIMTEQGGFATSEAADSYYKRGDEHVRQGAYYQWTRREFDSVVGEHSALAAAHWNVLQHGNIPRDLDPHDEFINQNVLRIATTAEDLSSQFGHPVEDVKNIIASAKEKLLAHREKERVRPATDEKVVAAYNGLVISALARTGGALRLVDPERAVSYLGAASKAARFIQENMWDADQKVLYRSFYKSRSGVRGFADDYAFLIEGLLDLAEATGDVHLLRWADELQITQINLFYDTPIPDSSTPLPNHASSGAFYSTEESAPCTILRIKDAIDTSLPSTNGVSASNLFRLAALLNSSSYLSLAKETLRAFEPEILQHSWLFVTLIASIVPAKLGADGTIFLADSEGNEQIDEDLHRLSVLPRGAPRAVLRLQNGQKEVEGTAWLLEKNTALQRIVQSEDGSKTGVYRWREKAGEYIPSE